VSDFAAEIGPEWMQFVAGAPGCGGSPAMVGEPLLACSLEVVLAGFADGLPRAGVLVVWCGVTDGGVEADGVVLEAYTRSSSAARSSGSWTQSRCGHPPFTWPKSVSICARSVGGVRPPVVLDDGHGYREGLGGVGVLGGPLSETASRMARAGSGTSRSSARG
jgi:hypothetical protein